MLGGRSRELLKKGPTERCEAALRSRRVILPVRSSK